MWTDRQVKSFEIRDKRYRVSDGLGQKGTGKLVLDIQPNGVKTFFYQYYRKEFTGSKRVMVKVGRYKDKQATPGLTLSDARNEAIKLSQKAEEGDLKIALQSEGEAQKQGFVTLRQALDDYIENKDLKDSTANDYQRSIKTGFAKYLDQPIVVLNRNIILKWYRAESKKGKTGARANNAMRVFKAIYNYQRAVTRLADGSYSLPENPTAILSEAKVIKKIKRRQTYLPSDVLKDWFEAVLSLDDSSFTSGSTMRDFLIFVLLTGVRREEARTLKRIHVNIKHGTFKLIDTKNHEDIELPMSQYLSAIIKTRLSSHQSEFVFPGIDEKKPFDAFKRPFVYLREQAGIDFTIHDLRRSFATYANSLDISYYTVKRLINHKLSDSDVTAGYIIVDMDKLRSATEKITAYILEKADQTLDPV